MRMSTKDLRTESSVSSRANLRTGMRIKTDRK